MKTLGQLMIAGALLWLVILAPWLLIPFLVVIGWYMIRQSRKIT